MNEPKDQATGTPSACHCSTVSLIDFQMTVANLSVAEHALREGPYERLPYLAGTMQVAQGQMESLRQEAMELKSVVLRLLELTNPLMQCDERELHRARQQAEKLVVVNPQNVGDNRADDPKERIMSDYECDGDEGVLAQPRGKSAPRSSHCYAFFRDRESSQNMHDGREFHAAGVVIKAYPKRSSGKDLAVVYWHPFECRMQHEWRSFEDVECYDIPDWMIDDLKAKYEVHKYA